MPNDDKARLRVGAVEGSNVNTVESMVGIIQAARQFETQMRLLQTAESTTALPGSFSALQG